MKRIAILVAVLALTLAACGDSDTEETAAPSAPAGVVVGTSSLGDHLKDVDGNTLYVFLPDGQGDSTCYDQCEANWPVFSGEGAGDGVDGALLGTSTRTDGNSQTTYNDWPLYYFANDAAAGDTNGQGVGGVWYVIAPAGDPIQ